MPGFTLSDGNGRRVPPLPGVGLASVPPGDFLVHYIQETVPLDADVYVIQTGSHIWQKEWTDWLRKENPQAKFVLELDDRLHGVPTYNPGKGDPAQRKDINRRHAQHAVEEADAVSVSTQELFRFYGQWNPNVTVVPNYLHWPMWTIPPVYERNDWTRFRVGYMGNADFHRDDLKQWASALQAWLQKHPDVEFVAAGDPRLHTIVGTPRGQRVTTAKVWFRNLDLQTITSTFDVGLAPLVKNSFNEAKSCLKGMEYGGCGIPVLASPTEEYLRFVQDGETGFHVKTGEQAVAALDLLYNDRKLLREMGEAAYDRARDHALDRHIGEWESFFQAVCDRNYSDRAGAGVAA